MGIRLKNNTRSTSKIGYVVIQDPKDQTAFVYAPLGSSSVFGVVTEAVPYRSTCYIATVGETTSVFVAQKTIVKTNVRLAKNTDNISIGACIPSKAKDAPFLSLGYALTSGVGLVKIVLNPAYLISSDVQSRIQTVTTTPYTVKSTDNIIVVNSTSAVDVYLPATLGEGRPLSISNLGTSVINVIPSGTNTIMGESIQYIYHGSTMSIVDYAIGAWIFV